MVILKTLKKWDLLFFVLFIAISFLYSYPAILFLRPCSLHQWRQCDCLSISLNYYKDGMRFFTPSMHNRGPTGNGLTCPTECPIIYYVVALFWKFFGYHEFIFRLLDTIIAFVGVYALFRLTKELVQDGAWALMVSLVLFTSPIFAVYANNFMPDVPALSVALIAWYFFVRYYKTRHLIFFYVSILFFLLAGLIKITALLSFVPLIAIFISEIVRKSKNPEENIFVNPFKQGVSILLLIGIISLWLSYSSYYRQSHNPDFFITISGPIWALSKSAIFSILNKLYNNLLPQYFNMPFNFFMLACFVGILINFKKMNRFYYWFISMVFAGCILYMLIWFDHFDVHDYYLINLLILIPIILVSSLVFLKEKYLAVFNSNLLKIIFALILGWNICYCAVQTNIRYFSNNLLVKHTFILKQSEIDFWNWYRWYYGNNVKAFETITPYLRSLGISRDDEVISIPDGSPNISLYLMDQKGYNDNDFGGLKKADRIKEFIHLGSKYLIISDSSLLDCDWLKPYLENKIGAYQNVIIYNLKNLN